MGALTINRKRDVESCFTLNNHGYPILRLRDLNARIDLRVSKKPKTTPCMGGQRLDQPVSSKNAASRISRYPAWIPPLKREVHGPCRAHKFGSSGSPLVRESRLRTSGGAIMESKMKMKNELDLRNQYQCAKNKALDCLRYFKKEKEVIVIDLDDETEKDMGSVDSGMEELGGEDYGRGVGVGVGGGTVFPGKRTQDDDDDDDGGGGGNVENMQESGVEIVEKQCQPSSSSVVTELMDEGLKVDSAEKMMDMLSLNNEFNGPLYEKLLETAGKRDSKLKHLEFQIKLNESRRSSIQSSHPPKKPEALEEDKLREAFVPLTKEEEEEVSRALCAQRKTVLVTHENSNIAITGDKFQCLKPRAWLNDEVINVYLELLKERERREPTKFLKCHFFNTFFYKKLMSGTTGYDYNSVRRWTTPRKLGYSLIECDKIFVPIHKEVHWCLAVINRKDEKFQYLDSLGGTDTRVLHALARYIVDEVKDKDKSREYIDFNSWEQEHVEDIPEQMNSSDCGMFMIKYADFYSRDVGLCFNQENMAYFRRRTAKEILRLRAD